jgi:hypothetical protein
VGEVVETRGTLEEEEGGSVELEEGVAFNEG